MRKFKETPSQTAGPYVHIGCVPSFAGLADMYGGHDPGARMITGAPDGTPVTLTLTVMDGAGDPVTDAMIEIWQPGPDGRFGPTEGFRHWGRQPTDAQSGTAVFETLMPGAPTGQAPHVLIWIVARGINLGLMTRLYFPGQENAADPVFRAAGTRAQTLLATPAEGGFHHNIHLQGPDETVFFDA
ncbi:protocatechuate 3,4-dioxygenase subunit alpha [Sulfitobacter albidus]|uniref:Protocatechuate 3,4-dioxygenase subunit alpha n=1 Tax=Sulfitobacter albidus TaxID=2829501 RepID=A0A975JF93_9RHOB|nr:protocatechuate 3,4-dioxygenase subunit alpha [Sulfitobacter albidus]QUJ77247.1 protocatechuate 3,4-dioxygenase subunit alpha [Sulfitobacter albidus]